METSHLLNTPKSSFVSYNKKDLILYSLSIGCQNYNLQDKFINEKAIDFTPFPTFPAILVFKGRSNDVLPFPSPTMHLCEIPKLPKRIGFESSDLIIDFEREIECLQSIPSSPTKLLLTSSLRGIEKTKNGALITFELMLTSADAKITYYRIVSGSIILGAEGFVDCGHSMKKLSIPISSTSKIPVEREFRVRDDAAFLYRLNGDYNQLHVNKAVAIKNGFKKPILHGLCTLGICVREVLQVFGTNKKSYKSCRGRFRAPVYEGDVLNIKMKFVTDRIIQMIVTVKQKVVLTGSVTLAPEFLISKL